MDNNDVSCCYCHAVYPLDKMRSLRDTHLCMDCFRSGYSLHLGHGNIFLCYRGSFRHIIKYVGPAYQATKQKGDKVATESD